MEERLSLSFESPLLSNWEGKEKNGVARSILVRGLPSHLSPEQSTDALRQLFSGEVRRANYLQVNPKEGQKSHDGTGVVPARGGALAQSSWRGSRLNPKEGPGDTSQRKINLLNHHHKQLLQQLPYAVSSIRVASDRRGSSIYAVVDFTHESLAKLALQVLGGTATLPGTSAQVCLSLYETWSTPLVVDQYHLYVSGVPPGATVARIEDILTSATGITPTHVKVSSVAGLPSRKGVQEYAFLRYEDEETAEEALKKLTNFGFIRLASHEAALAAITHLHGLKLHGRTLACAWSTRTLSFNEEEPLDDSWEREEEAYAVMSAQCMDYEAEPQQQPSALGTELDTPATSPRASAKRSATEAASSAFWLSILAENGPVNLGELCSRMKRRQRKVQQWNQQEWEEDTAPQQGFQVQVSESVAQ
ncbi:RNA recognition motif domain-containing protein, putative [Eimeria mitis]|uniref:RNA recognition motif domain-containing protein, putative n=1 Tax=Eimeria mitis TaxID=44415 RepID=U6KMJ2_9EIME|nr:RNA recognition motif domain-containing protein, putative [Eimeria mitis]CDJ36673.1 RNA recognition motif domain-containing protein, putative [Eimeria mitis]